MTRSKPAARQAAMAGSRQSGSSVAEPRVANERKKTRPVARASGVDGVHPDAVAEQGAAPLAPGGVDGQHRQPELVLLVEAEAADQLVGQRRLARAARAGDAEHGGPASAGRRRPGRWSRPRPGPACRSSAAVMTRARLRWSPASSDSTSAGDGGRPGVVALGDHGVDHGRQAHGLAVLGREDAGHPVVLELRDLGGHDRPAAPAVDAHVAAALLAQPVDQVLEVLDVAALVGADRHPLDVLLDGGGHHLVDRAVVARDG